MGDGLHPRIPSATYRLQFHAGFTFDHARAVLDYLRALGISDIYASPYFQASADSTHGYDVADHNRLNPLIGDEMAFREYSSKIKKYGMGQVLDFVPNHMGIGESLNRWWMDVLEDGMMSRYANYFDIDWHPAKVALYDRILLPVLGERYGIALEKGSFKLSFEEGAFFVHYFETKLPVRPSSYSWLLRAAAAELDGESLKGIDGCAAAFDALPRQDRSETKAAAKLRLRALAESDTRVVAAIIDTLRLLEGSPGDPPSFDRLHELLEEQVYRLSYWRVAAEEINYRRFFDINTLAGLRVEIPEVFEAAHQFVFEMLKARDVTGLRIDHVDGLWDPKKYLLSLQERYAQLCSVPAAEEGLYVVVEKILDLNRESLPPDWPVHGTTGYEFANEIVQVLTNAAAEKRMTKVFQRFTGVRESFPDLVYQRKLLAMQISLSSEVSALGKALDELSEMHRMHRDFTRNMLVAAIRETIACFPVYRTYISREEGPSAADERCILRAISSARRRNPSIEKPVLDFLRGVLLLRLPPTLTDEQRDAHVRFVMRFQQCTAPVMAKGVEDSAFYVYNRLVALNEVGGNPEMFGMDVSEFHEQNVQRAKLGPHAMLASSTHDTKRSEDVRMRIAALAEMPEVWEKALKRWRKLNNRHRVKVDDSFAPSRNEEFLIYQTLLGTWPLEPLAPPERAAYVERIGQYLLKCLKEAKVNSSWIEPNQQWEDATVAFVGKIMDEERNRQFCSDLSEIAEVVSRLGAMNSLTQTVLKCTLPGVPDFYQGTEIWDFSLVDPDNRRPVDYPWRERLLDSLAAATPADLKDQWKTGQIKLFVIQRLLGYRRQHALLFQNGDYHEVAAAGKQADRIIAFERRWKEARLLVIVPRITCDLGFFPVGDTWIETSVTLHECAPSGWLNILTNKTVAAGGVLALSAVLSDFPFAVLRQIDA